MKKNRDNSTVEQIVIVTVAPSTKYEIWIRAYTWKHEGVDSKRVILTTDISAPPPPDIVKISCQSDRALVIEWFQPGDRSLVDYYTVYYKSAHEHDYNKRIVPARPELIQKVNIKHSEVSKSYALGLN